MIACVWRRDSNGLAVETGVVQRFSQQPYARFFGMKRLIVISAGSPMLAPPSANLVDKGFAEH